MGDVIDITTRFKSNSTTTNPSTSNQKQLLPIIDTRTQELLGYTLRFPLPESTYTPTLPEGVIDIKGKPSHQIPHYHDPKFKGRFILNREEKFVGTVYDEDSPCFEVGGAILGGVAIIYRKNGDVNIACQYQGNRIFQNYTKIQTNDPVRLLLDEYTKNK